MTTLEQHHTPATEHEGAEAAASRRVKLPLAPSLERRRLQSYLMLVLLDGFAVTVGILFTGYLYLGEVTANGIERQWIILLPVHWTAALILKAYSIDSLTSLRTSQKRALLALLAALTLSLFIAFFAKSSQQYSRITTGLGVVTTAALLLWVRALVQPLIRLRCGPTAENVLVFDDGGFPVRIPHAWHIDTREHRLSPNRSDPHMLDRLGMFMANMDRVLVTCPPERRMDWALVFKGSNVCGEIIDAEVTKLGVLGARRGQGFGALIVSIGPLGLRSRAAKRAMDVAIAGGALLVLSPVLILVAILIRLEDRGPVFFLQQRQGRNNRLFWIYKFRSMRVAQLDAAGARSASKDDDRITRIGAFIRRTSIDELPQLFNVLRGDMSIVGPRPHAIGSLAGSKRFWEVDSRYLLRHSLKPGLTGLAQIRGLRGATDSEADLSNRLQADLEYLDGWTVLRDIRIVFATLTVLVHDRAF
ncbi:sugar transferase [Novosphingobium sp. KCTC 2891]|uniref:sugar transferase n=1 Tax=Novosphingobium sp. KCTC 2891 TaxID=2989730 RepID=UPI002221EDBA|nr:sugar transferase [Novosphingobium sp. KCTC 2891]MCW1383252.1 sugar transferase [Novosphingobium sp. KCTC 2891]